MSYLEIVDSSVDTLIKKVMRECHPDLAKAEVNVSALFHRGENQLRHRGEPAEAFVRITPPRERALLPVDAVITIDAKTWSEHDDEDRAALIDHELEHIKIREWITVLDAKGNPVIDPNTGEEMVAPERDNHDRPKLRIKPHDWTLTGFEAVAERRGHKAREVEHLRLFHESDSGQIVWSAAFGEQRAAVNGPPARISEASRIAAEKANARRKLRSVEEKQ